jgi:peroxiredoxin
VNPSPQSLRGRIDSWSAEHASDFPPEIRQLFADKTEEILKSGILTTCVRDGQTVPDFELPDSAGMPVRLGETIDHGPVILSFYRGTWCPYCTLEFRALLESMPRFRARGAAAVLAVSPQILDRHENPGVSGFVDLSDAGNRVARQFGLVFPLGEEIRKIYENFGIRLEELNGDQSFEVPIPATYIVDQDFRIRYASANADITERAEPELLLESLSLIA